MHYAPQCMAMLEARLLIINPIESKYFKKRNLYTKAALAWILLLALDSLS